MHSVSKFFGTIFQPIFHVFAWLLAAFYSLVPNYLFAIVMLTVVIMALLTPLTVKSTKSMAAMQRLQPELKKLQQKYKGPENRATLNEEMMKLYREEGVNPLGGCLPMLLQAPFLFILYNVIKGMSYEVKNKAGHLVSQPRYLAHKSTMYLNLVHAKGQVKVWGMDLSLRPFPVSSHGTFAKALPFFAFVAIAVALQYIQMAQLNNRSRKAGQPMPSQQLAMQRIMPIIFVFFYLVIPAAVVVYMIISTVIRIITQDIMFRSGLSDPRRNGVAASRDKVKETEREIPGAKEIEAESTVVAKKPPRPIPNRQASKNGSKARPAPKPAQPRSRDKRKRKAR
ncbi:MAG TPA: YidC/Oxa1 family membrane protein insertase [Acidimicrobiales bacterium]|jgi:YidC/Oxa1 family membrane protein insertase